MDLASLEMFAEIGKTSSSSLLGSMIGRFPINISYMTIPTDQYCGLGNRYWRVTKIRQHYMGARVWDRRFRVLGLRFVEADSRYHSGGEDTVYRYVGGFHTHQ